MSWTWTLVLLLRDQTNRCLLGNPPSIRLLLSLHHHRLQFPRLCPGGAAAPQIPAPTQCNEATSGSRSHYYYYYYNFMLHVQVCGRSGTETHGKQQRSVHSSSFTKQQKKDVSEASTAPEVQNNISASSFCILQNPKHHMDVLPCARRSNNMCLQTRFEVPTRSSLWSSARLHNHRSPC